MQNRMFMLEGEFHQVREDRAKNSDTEAVLLLIGAAFFLLEMPLWQSMKNSGSKMDRLAWS